jgi:hypothetical protein
MASTIVGTILVLATLTLFAHGQGLSLPDRILFRFFLFDRPGVPFYYF